MLAMLGAEEAPAHGCTWLRSSVRGGLSRREARHSRCLSAIGLIQKGNIAMTHLSNNTVATDIHAHADNAALTAQGYTIRHIETWHRDGHDDTCIVWDSPGISETDPPY
jgi:hypothetical protein